MRIGRKIDVLQETMGELSNHLVEIQGSINQASVEHSQNLGAAILRITEFQDELETRLQQINAQNSDFLSSANDSLTHHKQALSSLRVETGELTKAVKDSRRHYLELATGKLSKSLIWAVLLVIAGWMAGSRWQKHKIAEHRRMFQEVIELHEEEVIQMLVYHEKGVEAEVVIRPKLKKKAK